MNKLPLLTVLEAPVGYGKTTYLKNLCSEYSSFPVITYNYPTAGSEQFFNNLSRLCSDAGLPFAYTTEIFDWYRAWKNARTGFIFILDDFHKLRIAPEALEFIIYLLKNPIKNLHLVISSASKVQLPFHGLLSSGDAVYLDITALKMSLPDTKALWQKNGLEWQKDDEETFNYFDGWPGGMALYLKHRKKELGTSVYAKTLQDYLSEAIFPVNQRIAEHHNLRQEKEILAEIAVLPKVMTDRLVPVLKKDPEYWLYLSNDEARTPEESRLFLERALNLAEAHKENPLNILTRLAHTFSLLGDHKHLDHKLTQAEKYFEKGEALDRIAWLYLKANRLRQLCRYEEAKKLITELLEIRSGSHASLNLQTRARVLLGLIEYQQGNYDLTRKYYNEAVLLAQAEFNDTQVLELQIMLAFLDVWEGKESESLPENITELIEKQPLKAQPIMWLNLAFYWLLGEKLDLKQASLIIDKIKGLKDYLKWPYLEPLISDVEARVWRYGKEYEKAGKCHELVLAELEKGTFEYYHALLNQSLTFFKSGKKEDASGILKFIMAETEKNGSYGLYREAQVLFPGIENNSAEKEIISAIKISSSNPTVKITMFGGFKVSIGDYQVTKWQRKKSRHLLASLLLNPRGIHRETLADMIFPPEGFDNPLQNLDVGIHSLRKALEPDRKSKESSFIIFQDSCYSFNWSYPHRVDFIEFENYYKEWLKGHNNEKAEKAVELYDGELLPELDFAELWHEERESCHRKAVSLLQWLINENLSENNFEMAEQFADKLISLDNYNEDAYLLMMKIAQQKKDKTLLNSIYKRMSGTFEKELGEEPSQAMVNTYNGFLKELS